MLGPPGAGGRGGPGSVIGRARHGGEARRGRKRGSGMNWPDLALVLLCSPALILAGAAKAGLGGAGAFAATPLLVLVLPPGDALGVMLPILMAIDLATLGPYWRRWSWPDARALLIGGTAGVGIGWAVFDLIPPAATQLLIGVVAVVFVAFRVAQGLGWSPVGPTGFRPARATLWGGAAGVASFLAHAGGPPSAMALIPRRLDKTTYQATTVLVFWWVNLVKLGPYLALGLIGQANLALTAALLPAAGLGVLIGILGHHRLPQRAYDTIVLAGLAAAGAKLVHDGAAGLS